MRTIALSLLVFLMPMQLWAGEFSESGQSLDDQLEELRLQIEGLEERLSVLERSEPECRVPKIEEGQDPFGSVCLPGRIEIEDFDHGGEGVAYHDTTIGNAEKVYRDTESVDIKATGDVDGFYQVGWTQPGEWLEYTVNAKPGVYDIHVRSTQKTAADGVIELYFDGKLLGSVNTPTTGSWNSNYATTILPCVQITGGNKVLRLEIVQGPVDLNWIEFTSRDSAGNDAPCDIRIRDAEE